MKSLGERDPKEGQGRLGGEKEKCYTARTEHLTTKVLSTTHAQCGHTLAQKPHTAGQEPGTPHTEKTMFLRYKC